MEAEADGPGLCHIEPRRGADRLHQVPLEREQGPEAIPRTNERIARGQVDEVQSFQVSKVEDQIEARSGGVSRGGHPQRFQSLRLHLAGDTHGQMFSTKRFGDAVAVCVHQDGLLEIRVVAAEELARSIRVGRRNPRGIQAVELREESENETPPHLRCAQRRGPHVGREQHVHLWISRQGSSALGLRVESVALVACPLLDDAPAAARLE